MSRYPRFILPALVLVTAVILIVVNRGILLTGAIPVGFWLVWEAGRRLRLPVASRVVLLLAQLLYLVYLGYTPYGARNYDADAQLEYVAQIADHHRLPASTDCWVCHHPPLYYGAAAVFGSAFKDDDIKRPHQELQVLSLFIFLGFTLASVAVMRRVTDSPALITLGTVLITLWPYSVANSVRVHNDVLYYALHALTLFLTYRWFQDNRNRDFYLATLFAVLALLTKATGAILIVVLLLCLFYRLVRGAGRKTILKLGAVLVVCSVLAQGSWMLVRPATTEDMTERILGTAATIEAHHLLENRAKNYLYFDIPSYFATPYMIAGSEESGRQYHWNHVLKSSLFGTHNSTPDMQTSYQINRYLAVAMSVLLLLMTLYLLIGMVTPGTWSVGRHLPLVLSGAGLLAAQALFKIQTPAPHHSDFRLVFPVLISATAFYLLSVGRLGAVHRYLGRIGQIMALLFAALSALYFIPKWTLSVHLLGVSDDYQLSQFATPVPDGAAWDAPGTTVIPRDHYATIHLDSPRDISRGIISLDGNDRYEITVSRGGDRLARFRIGPRAGSHGMVTYDFALEQTAVAADRITVRPVGGDGSFSIGHLRVE